MKSHLDLARGWLLKAHSDLTNARLCIESRQALDTACFHAQQAAEKALKGYLVARQADFPLTHDLNRLVDLCAEKDAAFDELRSTASPLTPYAIELRYSSDFWPTLETASAAWDAASRIVEFVEERRPELRDQK